MSSEVECGSGGMSVVYEREGFALLAAARKPLERQRAALAGKLEKLDAELHTIGPGGKNCVAALFYVETYPGASTPDIVRATKVDPAQLSRMKKEGMLRNSGPQPPGAVLRWWRVGSRKKRAVIKAFRALLERSREPLSPLKAIECMRQPIEAKRAEVLSKLAEVDGELLTVGPLGNLRAAVVAFLRTYPGSTTTVVCEAVGCSHVCLSNLKILGVLRNDGARGRAAPARWWCLDGMSWSFKYDHRMDGVAKRLCQE